MKLSTMHDKAFSLVVDLMACFSSHLALAWKPDFIPPPEQLKKMEKTK